MLEHFHESREMEPVHVDGALVHLAVLVRVLEDHDPVDRLDLTLAVGIGHVASHLDDPDAAIGVDVDRDRLLDERLARD